MMDVSEFPGLLEDLAGCNTSLDVVEKGLNDFLDTKKMAFPRFFFLSNDEVRCAPSGATSRRARAAAHHTVAGGRGPKTYLVASASRSAGRRAWPAGARQGGIAWHGIRLNRPP